ncbi:MAG TPA: hypothetical protein VGJ09_03210 [Bryobacteraceae bacterium]
MSGDKKHAAARRRFTSGTVAAALVVWISCLCGGFGVLSKYSNTPGAPAAALQEWPGDIPRDSNGRSTLMLFAHPQCPCSRATLGELAGILAHDPSRLDVRVAFFVPSEKPADWSDDNLIAEAARIPGVHVIEDRDGALARKFGAKTSGQALYYDARGHLAFAGGITESRGHSGDNDGRDAITSLIAGNTPVLRQTPVFGCSLVVEK